MAVATVKVAEDTHVGQGRARYAWARPCAGGGWRCIAAPALVGGNLAAAGARNGSGAGVVVNGCVRDAAGLQDRRCREHLRLGAHAAADQSNEGQSSVAMC